MKKLIAVLTLLFAFTVSVNAQQKDGNPDALAKADAVKITEYLGLNATQQNDFTRLFVMKHKTLSDAAASAEKKSEMSRIVEMKIRASLTDAQIQKLDANPELMATLTGAPQKKK